MVVHGCYRFKLFTVVEMLFARFHLSAYSPAFSVDLVLLYTRQKRPFPISMRSEKRENVF
jgi:hypothetical protein